MKCQRCDGTGNVPDDRVMVSDATLRDKLAAAEEINQKQFQCYARYTDMEGMICVDASPLRTLFALTPEQISAKTADELAFVIREMFGAAYLVQARKLAPERANQPDRPRTPQVVLDKLMEGIA